MPYGNEQGAFALPLSRCVTLHKHGIDNVLFTFTFLLILCYYYSDFLFGTDEIQAHSQKVTSLDIGETGRVLVTGGQDRNVNLWAFGNEKCFMSLPGHNGQVDCVKFTSGDDLVYSADENGIIKRWDLNTQSGCVTFYGHMKSVRTLDFHPHGSYIFASGSNDTTVRLWDVRKSDSCFSKYRGHIANVNSVKFSPDGWWIASAGTEGTLIHTLVLIEFLFYD